MLNSLIEIQDKIVQALQETALMVGISLVVAVILGGLLGLILFVSNETLFNKNRWVYQILGVVLNIVRSVPFLILMIFLLPLSVVIVGTKIGSSAVIVPLSIAAIAFFGRLSEASFSEVSKGVLEAAIASGAKKSHIIV